MSVLLRIVLTTSLLLPVAPVVAAPVESEGGPVDRRLAPRVERLEAGDELVLRAIGQISAVNFAGPTVMIDGLRYRFAPDATVYLADSFGAPTLLLPGMIVEFYYREVPDGPDVIHALAELADASLYEPT